LGLVRGYKHDLDRNRAAVQAVRQELARRGFAVSEAEFRLTAKRCGVRKSVW